MHARQNILRRRVAPLSAAAVVLAGLAWVGSISSSVVGAPPAAAATYVGSAARLVLQHPIVGMAAAHGGGGYWMRSEDRRVWKE
jgi:hypothetical protein